MVAAALTTVAGGVAAVSSIDVTPFATVQQPDSLPCTQKITFLDEVSSFSSISLLFGGMLVPYPYTALSLNLEPTNKRNDRSTSVFCRALSCVITASWTQNRVDERWRFAKPHTRSIPWKWIVPSWDETRRDSSWLIAISPRFRHIPYSVTVRICFRGCTLFARDTN